MPTQKTDPLAAVRAAQVLADLAPMSRRCAEELVRQFGAHFEYRDGLRRLVLTGAWECDPSAVRAQADTTRVTALPSA